MTASIDVFQRCSNADSLSLLSTRTSAVWRMANTIQIPTATAYPAELMIANTKYSTLDMPFAHTAVAVAKTAM